MTTMIERVARAIYEQEPHYECGEFVDGFPVSPGGHLTWDEIKDRAAEFPKSGYFQLMDLTQKMARAAITAMREPTNEMLAKAEGHIVVVTDAPRDFVPSKVVWQLMIDAALKE